MQKKHLFVCGIGRSGTTELARILSTHSKIVLGIERFKQLWRSERIKRLTPAGFEKEQFFDFSQPLTNITPDNFPNWKKHYEAMAEKFDAARYVGDKMTQLWINELRPAFPDAKFIVIIRNVNDVAYSWDERAKRPNDRWPETHGARRAVLEWNKGLRNLADYLERFGDAVTYVEFHAFFGDPQRRELKRLLRYLDLQPEAGIARRFAKASKVYTSRITAKDRTLDPEDADFVARNADLDLWNQLAAMNLRAIRAPKARAVILPQ